MNNICKGIAVNKLAKKIACTTCRYFGYRLAPLKRARRHSPVEFSNADQQVLDYVLDNELTMASVLRVIATIKACKYVIENDVPGDFLECGVWRGGNSIAAKWTFENYGSDKRVYLCDTFAGMTEPAPVDVAAHHDMSADKLFENAKRNGYSDWCYASLNDVKQNCHNAPIEMKGLTFVEGDVRNTLVEDRFLPKQISVLRLDTDFYDSTKIEMEILYPRLSPRGTLLLDDYGTWAGQQKAVHEYFATNETPCPLLHYTDASGRSAIK